MLGGAGGTLTITHTTLSSSSYEQGIRIALQRAADSAGEVVVGLDAVLGLDVALGLPGARAAVEAGG